MSQYDITAQAPAQPAPDRLADAAPLLAAPAHPAHGRGVTPARPTGSPQMDDSDERETIVQLYRSGSGPTHRAPESTFTGEVRISGYFQRGAPSQLAGAVATFAPGSRTPWKVNPLGQTLIVTSGVGWAQGEGEGIVEIHAGDVLWCPPGQRHWEGATPDQAMTYVALHEQTVEFRESVTDEEYQEGP